jgi:hypothetical protein
VSDVAAVFRQPAIRCDQESRSGMLENPVCPYCARQATIRATRIVADDGAATIHACCNDCGRKWSVDDGPERRTGASERRRRKPPTDRRAGSGPHWSRADLIAQEPWDIVVRNRAGVLIVGPSGTIGAFLTNLEPWLMEPIVYLACQTDIQLPPSTAGGTLVLCDVDQLSEESQRRLMDWFVADDHKTQVISTAARPLIPVVRRGQFLEALYYRLNTFYIKLRPSE